MLSKLHFELVQDWILLLKKFGDEWQSQNQQAYHLSEEWQKIQQFLQKKILPLSFDDLDSENQRLWQSWQTETHRYLRLLHTDLLFFATAKQPQTKSMKASTITQHWQGTLQLSINLLSTVKGAFK
ncbi:MAG: heterocyst frequency control protein PatD [Cyanobacterium sp. T60_A2020_053]|nr:heterocyst frequency control protein PatD [Cyanobacterium sp. T60_A2020_053]